MSRILLADDSLHAQRMGEFILREEGFEVVTVTDGATAMVRLADVDPDVILADVSLPQRDGYALCSYVRSLPSQKHTRVLLTAGALEPIDEEEAQHVGADGSLRKPFEASIVVEAVKRLVQAAEQARKLPPEKPPVAESAPEDLPTVPPDEPPAAEPVLAGLLQAPQSEPEEAPAGPAPATADPQAVRAAVTLALESALPVLIDEVTQRILVALAEDGPAD